MSNADVIAEHPSNWFVLLADGCDVADRCEECPLRTCRFDDSAWFRRSVEYAGDYLVDQALQRTQGNHALTSRRLKLPVGRVVKAQRNVMQHANVLTDQELQALIPLAQSRFGRIPRDQQETAQLALL